MKFTFTPLLCFISIIATAQVYQFRGPNRDGQYPDKNLLDRWPENGPEKILTIEGVGEGYAAPAVTPQGIYVAGEKDSIGYLFAYDHIGNKLWQYEYGKEFMYNFQGSRSTPTIENNSLYFMGSMGDAFCLNTKNGKPIWHVNLMETYGAVPIRWGNTESPLLVDNKVIFTPGGEKHNIIALDKKSGKLIWTCQAHGEPSTYCSPILIEQGEKRVIVTQTANHVVGVNAKDGELLWSVRVNSPRNVSPNTPIIKNNRMFNSIGYGAGSEMYVLKDDCSTPDTLWTRPEMDNKMDGPVLVDGYIYGCGDRNRKWFCIDWSTGKIMWQTKDIKTGAAIVADHKIYIHHYDGAVSLLQPSPEAPNILHSFGGTPGEKLLFAHPVIYDRQLYIREGNQLNVYKIHP